MRPLSPPSKTVNVLVHVGCVVWVGGLWLLLELVAPGWPYRYGSSGTYCH
jgi:hypothetical protein